MVNGTATVLELVQEIKIDDLPIDGEDKRHEASGIHAKDGYLHIVFDDDPHVLRLGYDWRQAVERPTLLALKGTSDGYEDITYQPHTQRWYCLIEAAETKSGIFKPRVDEFDEIFSFIESHWLDFSLKTGNKGFEGLSTLRHAGSDYLLGLCEGNDCKGGKAGRKPGQGRIQVFKREEGDWEHVGTVKLPTAVGFKDYASLDFRNGYVTVISQETSAMWVGRVRAGPTSLDDLFPDEGRLVLFPRDNGGRILYCNVEGVTWIGDGRLAVVSDKAKSNQAGRCAAKDQSIHIFKLPDEFLAMESS